MGTDRLVFFRADGNSQIASGHLLRCISIAGACRALGMEVRFLVSDAESVFLLQTKLSADFPIIRLTGAAYDQLENELPELLTILGEARKQNPILFLDSYFVTESYLAQIRTLAKVVYLDDLMLFDYPVDLLINYDVISDCNLPSYRSAYQNAHKLLLGAKYAPLRNQFSNRKIPVREKVSNILITTGGSDPFHFCIRLIDFLRQTPFWDEAVSSGVTFRILIGYMSPDKTALASLAGSVPALALYENITDMASFMAECDLAVSAGGTTLYELCAVGLPSISYTMADNQIPAANAFASESIIPCAGDIRTSMESVMETVHRFLSQMTEANRDSYAKRKSAHETMRRLIDGNGSLKIAETVLSL
ncbi:MAG: UDP-2,4-diacetamido-2,4,6-trideoxy-beta-L-altropyranose hydrolase [Lachnospiraceae bacterium]|nr:UDP-2,4-diacetamido-2,4,6-trideoxy-beta-L-altropyranose hydrolase [Lachnospiraceae bacterium]